MRSPSPAHRPDHSLPPDLSEQLGAMFDRVAAGYLWAVDAEEWTAAWVAPVELDALHASAVEAACFADRIRVAAGEHRFKRFAIPHEFCPPGEPCWSWPTIVLVTGYLPGVRTREPIRARLVAA
jgi:hypothetical protein